MPVSKRNIKEQTNRVKQFVKNDIWNLDLTQFGKWKATLIRDAKTVIMAILNFGQQNLGLQAVALSFFTTMAFVPFVAVIFAIANKAGLGEYFILLLYDRFENDILLERVLTFADNIIATTQGPYGVISLTVFVWLVIWLFISVERVFNKIWKVEKSRKLWKRAMSYLIVLIITPFVLIFILSTSISLTDAINNIDPIYLLGYHGGFMSWVMLFVLITIFLTAAYILIPNAKVKFRSAIIAALLAGFAFTVVQYLYMETQLFVSRMSAVYGVFAATPLFMVWVNIAWFIVIIGSEISYSIQKVEMIKNKKYGTQNI